MKTEEGRRVDAIELIKLALDPLGVPFSEIVLNGTFYRIWMGGFNRRSSIKDLKLACGGNIVAEVSHRADYTQVVEALREYYDLQGDPVQAMATEGFFSAPLHVVMMLDELARERMLLRAEGSRALLRRNRYRRFQLSPAYQKSPCSEEEYHALYAEHLAGPSSLSFVEYYSWLTESRSLLSDCGDDLHQAAATRIQELMAAWPHCDEHQYHHWICRNMGVHPRHQAIVHRAISRCLAARRQGGA